MAVRRVVLARPCLAVRPVRRVGRTPARLAGQPEARPATHIRWESLVISCRTTAGSCVRGCGVGRLPGSGQRDLVRGRRVDVAAAAQQRRDRGDRGQGAATPNTTDRPCWNGPDISSGKNCLPVRTRWLAAGSDDSAPRAASRCWTGFTPCDPRTAGCRW